MSFQRELIKLLEVLADELIECLEEAGDQVYEGVVMTVGPPPYRRLDCDGRALAYVRVRPKKRCVRVDVSGLWNVGRPSRLRVKNAGGATTLLLRNPRDVAEAVAYLREVVLRTRQAEGRAVGLAPNAQLALAMRAEEELDSPG